ncbi:MAG: class I SAM-dependent methyltransferase [Candidatus Paceibacterota bacterium]
MKLIEKYHQNHVYGRRVHVLAKHLASLIPTGAKILDVGCGDGRLSSIILNLRQDVTIVGVDVLLREKSFINVMLYDGKILPFKENEFDVVLFIDVLHHTTNQLELLQEAIRVTSDIIIIKDHLNNNWFDNKLLILMDRVGNRRFGVNLSFEYWSLSTWNEAFHKLNLSVSHWISKLHLYQFPLNLLFDRNLHFISALKKDGNNPT